MANEKRLIDSTEYRSFLKKYINDLFEIDAPMIAGAVERCLQKLEAQPTVDAVEVVRCKDCKHWQEGVDGITKWCPLLMDKATRADDFCSFAERRCRQ